MIQKNKKRSRNRRSKDPIKSSIRPALSVAPCPETEFSRSVVLCSSPDYTPHVFERLIGGAHDPIVFPMTFHAMFHSEHRVCLLKSMIDLVVIALALHQPAEILLVTNKKDRNDGKDALAVVEAMIPQLKKTLVQLQESVPQLRGKTLDYVPSLRHIHIDESRYVEIEGQPTYFPLRKMKRCLLGCIDPRLLRVRTGADSGQFQDASWFTLPGCIAHFGNPQSPWKELTVWQVENLRHAKVKLGMTWLTVKPHEDCKAHPVVGEHDGKSWSMQNALRKRVRQTKKAIAKLMENEIFRSVEVDILAVRFGGQGLARRVYRPGKHRRTYVVVEK